jgi:hypothetical protein
MRTPEIADYARQMIEICGPKAAVVAATRARECERGGDRENAQVWRRVQTAITRMGPPHAS